MEESTNIDNALPTVSEPPKPINITDVFNSTDRDILRQLFEQASKDYKVYKNWKKSINGGGMRFNMGSDKKKWLLNRVIEFLIRIELMKREESKVVPTEESKPKE